jgi:hypothetical protein
MSNWTSKTLLIQVELLSSSNPYFVLVKPRQSADFDWTAPNPMAGFCLGKIKWLIPDLAMLKNKSIIHSRHTVAHNERILDFLYKNVKKYPRHTAKLEFLPDEVYNETVQEAQRLLGPLKKAAGWFASVIAESPCRSRDISIVEDDNGKIHFYTLAN